MQRSASTLRISGWSARRLPNARAVGRVPGRVGDAPAHPRGRADDAVQARVADHLDDRRHAAAGLADELRPCAVQLDLARRVGAVAELVLEALDVEGVAGPVGQDPRQREAAEALVGLREHEEQVAHRRRAEPLVAGQRVLAVGVAVVGRATVVLARTSEPPCFSVIAIPHSALALRRGELGVVRRRGQHAAPRPRRAAGDARSAGHGRERHRDRAGEAALGLRGGQVERRAGGVRGGLRRRPRQRVQLVLRGERDQVVPGAVELDLVDAVAVAVERLQPRRVLVGLEAPADRVRAPGGADLARALARPAGALALERLDERDVVLEQIAVSQRRDLVGDLVGVERGGRLDQLVGHAPKSSTAQPSSQRSRFAAEQPTSAGSGSSVSRRRSCSSSPINSAERSEAPEPLAVKAGS